MTAVAAPARERPILFSGPMVRAILSGQKTQTRRVLVPQPDASLNHSRREIDRFHCVGIDNASGKLVYEAGNVAGPIYAFRDGRDSVKADIMCPFGKAGDQLWVRESFAGPDHIGNGDQGVVGFGIEYKADGQFRAHGDCGCEGPCSGVLIVHPWKPSIHMPRWASRLTLEITEVRVERLQAITDDDARAEGMEHLFESEKWHRPDCKPWHEVRNDAGVCIEPAGCTCGNYSDAESFRFLWDSINAKRGYGWDVNPWVWVLSFRVLS